MSPEPSQSGQTLVPVFLQLLQALPLHTSHLTWPSPWHVGHCMLEGAREGRRRPGWRKAGMEVVVVVLVLTGGAMMIRAIEPSRRALVDRLRGRGKSRTEDGRRSDEGKEAAEEGAMEAGQLAVIWGRGARARGRWRAAVLRGRLIYIRATNAIAGRRRPGDRGRAVSQCAHGHPRRHSHEGSVPWAARAAQPGSWWTVISRDSGWRAERVLAAGCRTTGTGAQPHGRRHATAASNQQPASEITRGSSLSARERLDRLA